MSHTGYLWDPKFLGHETSTVHPERPERIEVLDPIKFIKEMPGLNLIKTDTHLGWPWTTRVHPREYVEKVKKFVEQGARALDKGDTIIKSDSFDVAIHSVSGALSVVEAIAQGKIENGFAAIRPPGHHASEENAKGFCIFNNVAICAKYAQERCGYNNVLIVDWDVHPADGTMNIFYEDPNVHLVSVHQDDIFSKGVCTEEQKGKGEGENTIVNIPLVRNSGETDYLRNFIPKLEKAAERAQPDIILISCGFDAHCADPIGNMQLTEASYKRFTYELKRLAQHYCKGRMVSLLEGGYNPAVLLNCTKAHLEALMD